MKYFVVMTQTSHGLRCVRRNGGHPGQSWDAYAFKSRSWAEKLAAKREGRAVYCVQGADYGHLEQPSTHYAICVEAERQFNPRSDK